MNKKLDAFWLKMREREDSMMDVFEAIGGNG